MRIQCIGRGCGHGFSMNARPSHNRRGPYIDGTIHALGAARPRRIPRSEPPERCPESCRGGIPGLRRGNLGWKKSASPTCSADLAVGESKEERADFNALLPQMPALKPRYLMGVVARRTSSKRCGAASTVRLRDADPARPPAHLFTRGASSAFATQSPPRYRSDRRGVPLLHRRHYTRAYSRHLDKCGEILGSHLNTVHNLFFYQRLMREIRAAIVAGTFEAYAREFHAQQT